MVKICSKCKKELSIEMFHKDGKRLRSECKVCQRIHAKEYRTKHPELTIALNKNNYEKNKDAINEHRRGRYKENTKQSIERVKQYYKDNPNVKNEYNKKYYEANREKMIFRTKKWMYENIDKKKATSKRRIDNENKLISTLTFDEWKETLSYFNNRCAYCNKDLPLAQEHVIPVAKGGSYTKDNIIPACIHCNSSKGSKDFFKWYPKNKHYSLERDEKIIDFIMSDGMQVSRLKN